MSLRLAVAAASVAALVVAGTACTVPALGPRPAHTPATEGASAAAPVTGAMPHTRRSGFADMSAATQAMQRDDSVNPAWLWVEDGRQRFAASCASCHEVTAMVGVATRYPAWDESTGRAITLGQRIAQCHSKRAGDGGLTVPGGLAGSTGSPMPIGAIAPDDETRIALETFVALQSRGQPLAPPAEARLTPWRERGQAIFRQRLGQLDLSCAMCHDERAGRRLAGSVIPQGHPTGYPIYRLEWQGMGSLQRRLRGCLVGVRAKPFAWDSDEMTALETYLASRAAGLPVETPAVRP